MFADTNVEEDVDQQDFLYVSAMTVNGYNHFGRVWLPTQFDLAVSNLGVTGGTDVHQTHR